jgi:hypothetical protein
VGGKRILLLCIAIGIIALLLNRSAAFLREASPVILAYEQQLIVLSRLTDTTFVLDQDTISYNHLATILRTKKTQLDKTQKQLELELVVPTNTNALRIKELMELFDLLLIPHQVRVQD